jgi:hypothetical protein
VFWLSTHHALVLASVHEIACPTLTRITQLGSVKNANFSCKSCAHYWVVFPRCPLCSVHSFPFNLCLTTSVTTNAFWQTADDAGIYWSLTWLEDLSEDLERMEKKKVCTCVLECCARIWLIVHYIAAQTEGLPETTCQFDSFMHN